MILFYHNSETAEVVQVQTRMVWKTAIDYKFYSFGGEDCLTGK